MSTTTIQSAGDIAEGIRRAWAEFVAHDRSVPAPHRSVYASAYRECALQMVRDMIEPDMAAPFQADTLANFRRGNDRERDLLADLKKIGRNSDPSFELVGEQERFELRDRKERVIIVGKVDARLKFENRVSAPLECKSWNVNTVARIQSFEDLFRNRWTRSGAYQLLAYLLGAKQPLGFLLLDRPGIPLLLPVELNDANLDRLEEFMQRATLAVDHVEAGTLPPFSEDANECKFCPYFGRSCDPPTSRNGAAVLTDADLIQKLERRHELEAAADEFEALDKEVKSRLRGVEMGIAGQFLIEGKWGRSTNYDIPENILKQYRQVDERGRFRVRITKV